MPNKKRSHGHRKRSKQHPQEIARGVPPFQSDSKQPNPASAVLVSTVKPTEKGTTSSSSTAAKPGTPAVGSSTPPTVTAPSTVPSATAAAGQGAKVSASPGLSTTKGPTTGAAGSAGTQSGSPKVTSQAPPASPAKAPHAGVGSGATGGVGAGGETAGGTGAELRSTSAVKPKDTSKDKAQSAATSSSKPEPPKVTSTGVGKSSAAANVSISAAQKDVAKSKEAKVHAEGPTPAAKASVQALSSDPFDALADSLPSSDPLAPTGPQYTGPEVKERDVTSDVANRCGEKESTLPPGYRREDMEKKIPAGIPAQPEKHPKPLTTDEALESLSAGFVSSEVSSASKPGAQKAEHVGDANARSSNAPSPQKKQDVSMPASLVKGAAKVEPASSLQTVKPKTDKVHAESKASVQVSAADPFDALADSLPSSDPLAPTGPPRTGPEVTEEKKIPAGIPEKPKDHAKPLTDDVVDSLSAGFVSSSAPKLETKRDAAPPADKKAKVEKLAQDPVTAATPSSQPVKSKTDEGNSMSLEALEALGDMLPDSLPTPEAPAPRPEDIVKERDLNPEAGVLVGEREDTLPPEYRFSEEALKKYPAPPKEPSLDSAEALDILDFSSCAAAPAVQAPPPPSAPPKQPKVEDLSALDALEQVAVSSQTKQVACAVPSAPATVGKSTAESISEGDPMSLDALSALGDTLPVVKPTPESPKLKPEDIIDEKKLVSEKGVFVGEREDTLPPDYRFPKETDQKQPPPPRKEPSLDEAAALGILDKDFGSPDQTSGSHAPLSPSAPPTDSSVDFAIKDLAGDFVAPTAVSKVQSAVPTPPKADRQLSESTTSAMDALGDTLMDVGMTPEPAPVSPKDIVKEKEAVEERVSKPGERDDSIPEEYRPTEADKKADAEAKAKAKTETAAKQTSMDESAALDALSSDFSTPSVVPPAVPVAKTPPTKTVPEPVLDSLADTLRPHFLETKPKDSKSKVKEGKSKSKPKKPAVGDVSVPGDVSGKMTTDVVSTSSAKKGGKS